MEGVPERRRLFEVGEGKVSREEKGRRRGEEGEKGREPARPVEVRACEPSVPHWGACHYGLRVLHNSSRLLAGGMPASARMGYY